MILAGKLTSTTAAKAATTKGRVRTMANLSPDAAAAKWASRLSASTADIAAGVDRTTTAPGVAAARNKQGWLNRVTASADKWARNVAAVPLSEWQDKMKNVGIPRIASGAQANQPKFQQFLTEFLPHVQAGRDRVRAMPKTTLEEGIARSAAMIRHNANFKRSGSRG